jgi:hypothetical protein
VDDVTTRSTRSWANANVSWRLRRLRRWNDNPEKKLRELRVMGLLSVAVNAAGFAVAPLGGTQWVSSFILLIAAVALAICVRTARYEAWGRRKMARRLDEAERREAARLGQPAAAV